MSAQSVTELEHEVQMRRERVEANVDQLERKLTPASLLRQVSAVAPSDAGQFVSDLANRATRHPVPVAASVAALAWLAVSSRRSGKVSTAHDSSPPIPGGVKPGSGVHYPGVQPPATAPSIAERRSIADTVSEKVAGITQSAGEIKERTGKAIRDNAAQVGNFAQQAQAHAGVAAGHVRRTTQQVRNVPDQAGAFVREQPLLVGALAVALGALAGAVLRPTRQEDELLGKVRDDWRDQAARQIQENARAATEKAAGQAMSGFISGLTAAAASTEQTRSNKPAPHGNQGGDNANVAR